MTVVQPPGRQCTGTRTETGLTAFQVGPRDLITHLARKWRGELVTLEALGLTAKPLSRPACVQAAARFCPIVVPLTPEPSADRKAGRTHSTERGRPGARPFSDLRDW